MTAVHEAPARARVAVVGNLAHDRIDGGPPRPGGAPFFAALAFRLLAREGQILTRCAAAERALFEEALAGLGTGAKVLSAERTSGFEHAYDGEVRSSTVTSLGDPWTPEDAEQLAADVEWVHVAPLARSDFPADALAALAADGRRLSFDGQGLVRAPQLGPLTEDAAFEPALLDAVAVLKLSEDEARIVAGGAFDETTAAALGVPEILVTLGSRGAVVWLEGVRTHVPVEPVTGVETTGAGDAFMVAYAVARLEGADPVAATRAGGALVAELLTRRRLGR
jgi:sugar/nucleoside kinase (ribokinase family)